MLNKLLAFITILLTTLFTTACESDSDSNEADAQLRCEQSDSEPCEEDQGGEDSDPVAGDESPEDLPVAENPEAGEEVVAGEEIPVEAGSEVDCSETSSDEDGCVEAEEE